MSTEIYTQESGFYSMDLDPSKQFVAINYIDGSIIALLNLMTGEVEGTLVGLEDLVYEISWGTAGVAAIDTSGSQIIVWNPDTQSVITTIDTINLTRDVEWIPNQPAITYSGQANDGLPSIANISTARGTSFFCSGKAC
jgi:hypothetical protein